MQPYNYSIDLPKPPADNFLQNIMGIAQLQQMGQQQKIAAQQAAFQKEMQPLEMDKVREQIKAAQASAAQSAASTRGLNISADEAKRQQDYIKEVDAFTSKPVSEWQKQDVERLARLSLTKDARIGKGIEDFYESQKKPELKLIDDYAMKAGIAISQGRKDVADKITKEGIAEADKLGFKTASAFLKFGDSQVADDPAEAYATIVGHLARDKNKLDQFIAASELKGKLAKTEEESKGEKTKSELQEAQARLARADAALKEIDSQGGAKSDRVIKQENLMRSAFSVDPVVRNYESANRNWDIIQTADNSTAGDRARIVSFIKLQQPDSVVSVTESGQIEAPTASQQVKALIQKFQDEGLLGYSARKELESQAKSIYKSSEFSFKKLKANTEKMASGYGIDPKNVTGLFEVSEAKREEPVSNQPASGQSAEEARIRSMLRPAAGFGNTMTPSQIQPQGGTFQGTPTDVDAILKQFGVR